MTERVLQSDRIEEPLLVPSLLESPVQLDLLVKNVNVYLRSLPLWELPYFAGQV